MFRKTWSAFLPLGRLYLLRMTSHEGVWSMPEMFEYASDAILAGPPAVSPITEYDAFAWPYVTESNSSRAIDRPLLLRILDLAEERNSLDRLLAKIEDAATKAAKWKTWAAMRAPRPLSRSLYDGARTEALGRSTGFATIKRISPRPRS